MCSMADVLNSTNGSASGMTAALTDYSGKGMGDGIRKLAENSYYNGFGDGVVITSVAAIAIVGINKAVAFYKQKRAEAELKKINLSENN